MSPSSSAAPGSRMTPRPSPDAPENGAVENFLIRLLGRSWRTTAAGIVALVCGVVVVIPGVPVVVVNVCHVILPIVSGAGLLIAKDSRVSGTDAAAAPRRSQKKDDADV